MPTVKPVEENDASIQVAAIYTDIKKAFGPPLLAASLRGALRATEFAPGELVVPNLFKAMAHHPAYLEATWNRYKAIMLSGQLDRRTKEIVAVAVSATNGCEYCVNATPPCSKIWVGVIRKS